MIETDVTPTEYLVLETLAARYRLGEKVWPFPRRLRYVLSSLERKGLIGYKNGVVEKTENAWLTHQGRLECLSETYARAKPLVHGTVVGTFDREGDRLVIDPDSDSPLLSSWVGQRVVVTFDG